MSKLMDALAKSQGARSVPPGLQTQRMGFAMSSKTSHWSLTHYSIALLLPATVMTITALNTYQTEKAEWLNAPTPDIYVDVPFEFSVSDYQHSNKLMPTFRDFLTVEKPLLAKQESVVRQAAPRVPKQVSQQAKTPAPAKTNSAPQTIEDDLLNGLDLSVLSPELAQRFESALSNSPSQETPTANREASNLSQQADRWYGKLPALNFQTHVYSSSVDKRWVKINDVEYGQGDRISNNIELVAIEPQSCLIRYRGELIEIPALFDWKG